MKECLQNPLTFQLLETEDELLYHNTSSAILDAALFPYLSSTPLWVRLLYWSLAWWPAARRLMTAKLLWIQLQMMYFAHDFREYHGSIGPVYLWTLTHPFMEERPPKWVFKIEWWSISMISQATHGACYWLGRLFLGMKAEYPEYTPSGTAGSSGDIKGVPSDTLKTTSKWN